ncbi:MAG: 2,3-diaminopropionate biosynthesis protein SbnA [Rhizobiaceae bacterium]|nr:2,3-diaminopropionate biosynthesis protein SbnA [Rhizobiaceae bacterium]
MSTAQIYELPVIAQGMGTGLPSLQNTEISANVVDSIGNTPMIRLSRYLDLPNIDLIAKLEASNPGGSAKDRPARRMIEEGLKDGSINAKTTIIESSSGNMGIGLAQICRYHGLRFICVVDPNAQAQNVAIIRALGAEVRLVTEPLNGDFLAARLALVKELLDGIEDSFWPNQYSNLNNPLAHEFGTIREIDDTLGGAFDYLFVATSSTGTARGCRDYLAKRGRHTAVVAVDAAGSILFNGNAGPRKISGMGAGTLPDLARDQHFDDVVRVSDIRCVAGCRRAAAREALLVGGSGGGVLEAVRQMQSELVGKTVAVILHDSGVRYLETVFNDAWVEKELGCSAGDLHTMANSRF